MFCPSCGYNAEDAKFCPECGNDLAALRDRRRRIEPAVCGACGAEVRGAKFCPECGQEAVTGRGSQPSASRPAARPATTGRRPRTARRTAERAAASEPNSPHQERRRKRKLPAIIGIAVPVVAVVALVVMLGPGEEPAVATETVGVGGKVKISLQDLAGGDARFYTYDVDGVPVKFFALLSSDGQYRAALDASKECGPSRKGFRQEGTDMVCNKCGERFAFTTINVVSGACNPTSIEREVSGQDLVLKTADLEKGAQYFQ